MGGTARGLGRVLGPVLTGAGGAAPFPLTPFPPPPPPSAAVTSAASAATAPAAAVPLDAAAAAAAPVAGAHVRPVARLRLTHSESQTTAVRVGTQSVVQLVQLVVVER